VRRPGRRLTVRGLIAVVIFASAVSAVLVRLRAIAALRDQVLACKSAEAAYQSARLNLDAAEDAVIEYAKAIHTPDFDVASGEIALARSDLRRASDRLAWSDRMLKKGYVSQAQNTSERLSLERSTFAERQAKAKVFALLEYVKDQAVDDLKREVDRVWKVEQARKADLDHQEAVLKQMQGKAE
jgi:hypothetical protein